MRVEVSAGGIVYKKTEKGLMWLVVQHSYRNDHWGFPKGHIGDIHTGEPIEVAALREVREEGGIEARIIAPVLPPSQYAYRWQDELINKSVHYFLMEYVSGSTEDHDIEIQDAQFLDAETAMNRLRYNSDRQQFIAAQKLLSE